MWKFPADPNVKGIRISIDRGGTFTDCLAEVPVNGKYELLQYKLLSEDPRAYSDAPTEGIRRILEAVTGLKHPKHEPIDSSRLDSIRMATTVATNALLERKGEKFALVVTKGFRDVLAIGNQSRPNIFDLKVAKPDVLYEEVVEVDERVTLAGYTSNPESLEGLSEQEGLVKGTTGEYLRVLKPLDDAEVRLKLGELNTRGIFNIAVVLMHSYTFPAHENRIAELAQELGFEVTKSSELLPMIRFVPRGTSTLVDAYLTPCIKRYLNGFVKGFDSKLLERVEVLFMQSDGGLSDLNTFSGFKAVLSGPAGGVVGYSRTSCPKPSSTSVIGFDMGGTSTDVSRYNGRSFDFTYETTTAGVSIVAPQLDIHTVAAGGGSRLFYKNGLLVVGPESAGAHPGPTCYKKGGPLTITDANLVLGRLVPDYFPRIFGEKENEPLDYRATRQAFESLLAEIKDESITSVEALALGFIKVANETMTRPIRNITQGKGFDTKQSILACFGGAGGQHACSIAKSLKISTIHINRFGSVLSAYGLRLADIVEETQEACVFKVPDDFESVRMRLRLMRDRLQVKLEKSRTLGDVRFEYYLHMRYSGTDTTLMTLGLDIDFDFVSAFTISHEREYGFTLHGRDILVDDLSVRAILAQKKDSEDEYDIKGARTSPGQPISARPVYFESLVDCPVYQLSEMKPLNAIDGPALIIDQNNTILVEPRCTAIVSTRGNIVIQVHESARKPIGNELDPIQLSIFSNRFMSIAEQMGTTLRRTAVSTNIKERLDFSCALFGPDSGLVANAPHLPVHLGSMQEAVRHQMEIRMGDLRDGDVLVCNHPLFGGSHLPDITTITPYFEPGAKEPAFFVASRGHHADIGGIAPGSMPPTSKELIEEGAIIKSFKLVENGRFQEEGITKLLFDEPAKNSFGTRNLSDNISDLKAQVAANSRGIKLIKELIEEYTLPVVVAYMKYIRENAKLAVENLLKRVAKEHGAVLEAEEYMDDGSLIKLRVSIDAKQGNAVFDFTGSSEQVYSNLNAPPSVTYSAIIYCLRCLVDEEIPLNQGCLEPVTTTIPQNSLLSPSPQRAVVGGNVLTSQRLVDVIFKAFQACAASQGCMNNLTFGMPPNADNKYGWGYYETIAGGSGACPDSHGTSGVHTHMTNTRITDAEILERRYPVVLKRFELRRGSGGRGKFNGGDGVIREIKFTERILVSILSERRVFRPYGLFGGEDGQRGKNLLYQKDGVLNLGGKCSINVNEGDVLSIATPGGGGYGSLSNSE